MDKTAAELVARAGALLGLSSVGNPLAAEDADYIGSVWETVVEELNALGFLYIGDADAIPAAWFETLVRFVAARCGPDYGKQVDPTTEPTLERRLRRMVAMPSTNEAVETEYY